MIPLRALILILGLLAAAPAPAQTVAEQAEQASEQLLAAVSALEQAEGANDQVQALSDTIRAYEQGLSALREAMRQVDLRMATLELSFDAKRERIAQLLAVLARIEQSPATLLLLHPDGPLGTARSGMMLAEVTPALQAEAGALRDELQELSDLRTLQASAGTTLERGLLAAQQARTALSKAISDRTDLPLRLTEDPDAMAALLESSETLDAFAQGLAGLPLPPDAAPQAFAAAMGRLPLPTLGTLILRPGESDAAGVRRPGMTLATRPRALVTAPWPATIRYLGPLLDYGNVIVIEPGDGYLMVLAGLGTLYGEVGQVLPAGAPLGLMGGVDHSAADLPDDSIGDGTGAGGTETLYLELRLGADPVDPMGWFAATATTGE